jgi:phage-related protein
MEVRIFDESLEEFIQSLEKPTIAKVLHTIELLEAFGHRLIMPHSKKVAGGIFELRIRGNQEVRIFYAFDKTSAVLLHGFVKKSQKTPLKEIRMAVHKLKGLTDV